MSDDRPNRIYPQVEVAMLYLQGACRRTEAALDELRTERGAAYAIEALERALAEMTGTCDRLRRDGLRLEDVPAAA